MQTSPGSDDQAQPAQSEPQPQAQEPTPPERDLGAELAQMEDRFKRAVADLDNYRKRAAREVGRLVDERTDAVLLDWLEVTDGIDRALAQDADGSMAEGLRAVRDQAESILARHGVRRVGAPGEPFDPTLHEAVEVRATEDAADRAIVDVVRAGYLRGDRVLRPAQVVVARAPQRQT